MRGKISILMTEIRACKDSGSDDQVRSISTRLYIPWKFFRAIVCRDGNMSTPKYLKLVTIGIKDGKTDLED